MSIALSYVTADYFGVKYQMQWGKKYSGLVTYLSKSTNGNATLSKYSSNVTGKVHGIHCNERGQKPASVKHLKLSVTCSAVKRTMFTSEMKWSRNRPSIKYK